MDEDGSPACFKSRISTSKGHALFLALVIMAMTLCPITLLNVEAQDKMSAGRRFVLARSMNGKGTATTESAARCPFINFYMPLRHDRYSTQKAWTQLKKGIQDQAE